MSKRAADEVRAGDQSRDSDADRCDNSAKCARENRSSYPMAQLQNPNSKSETRNKFKWIKKTEILNGMFGILKSGLTGLGLFRILIFGFRVLLNEHRQAVPPNVMARADKVIK